MTSTLQHLIARKLCEYQRRGAWDEVDEVLRQVWLAQAEELIVLVESTPETWPTS